jgi:hypothetical protein
MTVVNPNGGPHTFTLTTFASGFPNNASIGPFGVAFRTDGKVLVTDGVGELVYLFPSHADNQVATSVPTPGNFSAASGILRGMAQIPVNSSWRYFLTREGAGVVEIDENAQLLTPTGWAVPAATGITPFPPAVVSPHNGHLFVSSRSSPAAVYEVDPSSTGTIPVTLFQGSTVDGVPFAPDGISCSPDGTILYVASQTNGTGTGRIIGMGLTSTNWGTVVYDSGDFGDGIDGLAVGVGTLTGYIYANFNGGDVWEVGLPGGTEPTVKRVIAMGGSRGDFIATDTDVNCSAGFPSLLLTQTDSILRLDPPGGGWFAGPTSSTKPVIVPPPVPAMSRWEAGLLAGALGILALIAGKRRWAEGFPRV